MVDPTRIEKCSGFVPASPETLADTGGLYDQMIAALTAPPPTPEQLAARQRERDERNAFNQAAHQLLLDVGGIVATIADLHWPDDGYCRECGGEDPPHWPCDTTQALIEHLEAET
jgi:hypothetical protein